jgi:hypothetical protein
MPKTRNIENKKSDTSSRKNPRSDREFAVDRQTYQTQVRREHLDEEQGLVDDIDDLSLDVDLESDLESSLEESEDFDKNIKSIP